MQGSQISEFWPKIQTLLYSRKYMVCRNLTKMFELHSWIVKWCKFILNVTTLFLSFFYMTQSIKLNFGPQFQLKILNFFKFYYMYFQIVSQKFGQKSEFWPNKFNCCFNFVLVVKNSEFWAQNLNPSQKFLLLPEF